MTMDKIKKCSLYETDEITSASHSTVPPETRYSTDKQIGNLTTLELKNLIKECNLVKKEHYIGGLTVSELKTLIMQCLREIEEEKQFSKEQYKALWIKPPMTTDGFKC